MITLYGSSRSRASRSLIALAELGLAYRHVPLQPQRETRTDDFLRLNPNGRVPCLEDGGCIVWESFAINLHLAERYGTPPLLPATPEARAGALQWSFWHAAEIEPVLISAALAQQRGDGAAVLERRKVLMERLAVLDGWLSEREFLLGNVFAIADLNVASAFSEPHEDGRFAGWQDFDLAPLPRLERWLERCTSRASWARVRELP